MRDAYPMFDSMHPTHSAVVEACAGSGKTWLLVSRMLRLLLAGAKPSELLAITFTRKAAEEMRERLFLWLEELASRENAYVVAFLTQRGLSEAEAVAALPRARGLYEAVLHSLPGPMITTFHGWFLHLLDRAPLTRRAPDSLIEDVVLLQEEAWLTWAESLRRPENAGQAEAFRALLQELPLDSVRKLLFGFVAKRAEWWAWESTVPCGSGAPAAMAGNAAAQAPVIGPGAGLLQTPAGDACATGLQALAGLGEDADVVGELLAEPGFLADLREFLPLLARNGERVKADAEKATTLAQLLERVPPPQPSPASGGEQGGGMLVATWPALQSVFLTAQGAPLSRKPSAALDGRLTPAGAGRFVDLHQQIAERILSTKSRLEEQNALRLNRWGLTAGLGLLARYQELKAARDGLDFTDAEYLAWRLLSDPEHADALLAKLDARWKHLLLDEFQDANPLQWQILTAWLSAYGADPERPTVFLVGDPKQSIYRFRRAEPRIFATARQMLERDYAAVTLLQNETRRCAPRVVAWVNAVFEGLGDDYPGYVTHTAHQASLPGWCEVIGAPPPSPPEGGENTLRDPLREPPPSTPEKRAEEARLVAARILECVGRLEIQEGEHTRPARFEDILVLSATRTGLEVFEDAFKAAGVPYITSRRGGLLDTLEAADLIALLRVLVMPLDDLSLAHVLKSPLFGFSDEDLKHLAGGVGPWLNELGRWAGEYVGRSRVGGSPVHELDSRLRGNDETSASAPWHVTRAHTLLTAWREAAGHLPPHDLLDRVFHQGDVEARYAAAVPERLRPGVLANLRALLEWSLKLGGGRFPSLPRFLDELTELRRRGGDEAPDEPPAAAGDVVRMLTIHAAKGLESPVVFLIKADEARRDRDHYGALVDWPAEAAVPTHFSLYGPSGWRGTARDPLFAQEQALEARENLNLLYVAMTRAKQGLFVSGLDGAKAGTWLARLATALEGTAMEALPEMRCGDFVAPANTLKGIKAGAQPNDHWITAGAGMTMAAIGRRKPKDSAEVTFGIQVHRYLELATAGQAADAIRADLGLEDAAFSAVQASAEACLAHPQARRFFAPGFVSAHNELEFLDEAGELRRIDRLVEFEDAVWVLDYKTGGLDEPDLAMRAAPYLEQITTYRRAAEALYPGKPVHAALLFADGQVLELPSGLQSGL